MITTGTGTYFTVAKIIMACVLTVINSDLIGCCVLLPQKWPCARDNFSLLICWTASTKAEMVCDELSSDRQWHINMLD